MKRIEILAICVVLALGVTMPAIPQASQSESQTLQAILSELRSIHNDVRLTAISQILLTELQTQQTVVNAATDRVSRARLELSSLQADEKRTSADLASSQDALSEEADSATKRTHSEEVDRLKASLAFLKAKEEGLDTNLQKAEGQLRSAQDTLDEIQGRLGATVKRLQPVADSH